MVAFNFSIRCPICGSRNVRRSRQTVEFQVGSRTLKVKDVDVDQCPRCGERFYDHEASQSKEKGTQRKGDIQLFHGSCPSHERGDRQSWQAGHGPPDDEPIGSPHGRFAMPESRRADVEGGNVLLHDRHPPDPAAVFGCGESWPTADRDSPRKGSVSI